MNYFHENDDDDLRAEARRERAEQSRAWHWCSDCHGHTGPGSPCYDGPEEETEDEPEPEEDESAFCAGCNPQVTQDERDRGRCACCGKELA